MHWSIIKCKVIWASDSFHASFYWHNHGQPSFVSPSSHTYKALSFSTTGSRKLHIRIFAPDVALVFNPSQAPIPNLPAEALSIHLHHGGIMPPRCSFLCRTCPVPSPCSLTETSPLYLLALHQHVSTFPKHGGKNWI